ncbi:axin-2 [Esox lucius]|uniref:Axin 2 n=1 Tax=Esox lucius TaxID=8010 RepID=A0A3P8XJC8_ESOLU|nr:axin-2 [Esox lucius]XP_010895683.1 axin-2 [Esox lucius]
MSRALMSDHNASSFREDAPRPPVPGEEGEAPPCFPGKLAMMRPLGTATKALLLASPSSTARRNEDGLGEPEGSASPDSPLARWTKSLHSLLGDQDGAHLFRTFLEREKCVDTLDFWFACNGFRQMDLKDTKTLRLAKVIYKRYIDTSSIVAKQLKPATKTFIRDNIKKQQIDSAMFDQAQTEIQSAMEESAYQMFLTSDIYLEYVRSGGENPAHVNPNGLGSLKLVCGYLPTLNEEEEWSCNDFKAKALASVVGLSAKALRATVSMRTMEVMEKGYRRGGPVNPYHVGSFAPATSTNDSEVSSDAMTDDSMSMTDSSVDGIPPFKLGSKKHLQREMHRNMRMNSQVSLPAFPRTQRCPMEMTPVEPAAFAAQLISRLERLKREQETISSLEERLQQIQEEEERDEAEVPGSRAPHPLSLLPPGSSDEDPQAILDDHLSRVLKTPGCQSPPAVGRHSPRSRSPERRPLPRGGPGLKPLASPGASSPSGSSSLGGFPLGFTPARALTLGRPSTKHIHHHYIHHHATPKSKEQMEMEAAQKVSCLCPVRSGGTEGGPLYPRSRSLGRDSPSCGSSTAEANTGRSSSLSRRVCEDGGGEVWPLQLPCDGTDRSQTVWQWILESDRQGKHHKPHSTQSTKKAYGSRAASNQTHTWGGGGASGHHRTHQPVHPFIQDPAMPPLPPPNTLAQLEEACRRLEEVSVSNPPKQRHCTSSLQREKSQPVPVESGVCPALSPLSPGPATHQSEELKEPSRFQQHQVAAGCRVAPAMGKETVVTYFFCGEEIPYRRMMKTHRLTLGHFKEQLRKKGHYRYYFKKASDEFECGAVFEEVWDDSSMLPMYEGKILGKVERVD